MLYNKFRVNKHLVAAKGTIRISPGDAITSIIFECECLNQEKTATFEGH